MKGQFMLSPTNVWFLLFQVSADTRRLIVIKRKELTN
jgi:hypothetical protein